MVDWITLAVPFAYLSVLIGSLATFSSLYRKRKARNASSLEPWFPPHLQRDIYFSLMHLDPATSSSSKEKKAPAVPESVLKAALLRRAAENIKRLMTLRSQKQALSLLLQRGSVGDDLWQRFLRAEKEMEEEVRDVVAEANAYVPNWGQTIFQSANEMVNNAMVRQRLEAHQSKLEEEKQWWERKKSRIQEGFMKELDAEGASAQQKTTTAAPTPVPAPAATPVATPAPTTPKKPETPSVTAESDDDAVLVEADDQAANAESPSRGTGGKKKKKGKK
ncbi:translocation protein [Aspergillus rambellii]|uniref:Translocation protein n=1 Tax=Aspergillus rambellii TaxID=308745 RepID=A0A0F8U9L1_9EURO|nr:translocation protein [Aspergillus rambellii]